MNILHAINIFLIKHLLIIHKGTVLAKAKSTLALALASSPITYVLDKITSWSIENHEYIIFVFVAIAIDHVLGTIKHAVIIQHFSFKKNLIGLIVKVGLVVTVGVLFEGVNHIIKGDSFIKDYMQMVLRLCVFLYPAGSAFMNSAIITNGKFPPIGWIKKVKSFNKNLDLSHFRDQEKVIKDLENEIENPEGHNINKNQNEIH